MLKLKSNFRRLQQLLAVIAVSGLAPSVYAATTYNSGNFTYSLDTDTRTAKITQWTVPSSGSTTFTFPGSVTYNGTTYTVTDISGTGGYDSNDRVTTVSLPATLNNFDLVALLQFPAATSITMASGSDMYKITNGCLYSKDGKTLLKVPRGYKGTFTFPSGVTDISNIAFASCRDLTNVTIPSTVTSITSSYKASGSSNGAFIDCQSLKSVTWSSSLTTIPAYTFNGCDALNFSIPSNITSIGESAFFGCDGLTSVTIPASVNFIGDKAFSGCSNIKSVTINSNSYTSKAIFGPVFTYCDNISSINITTKTPASGVLGFPDIVYKTAKLNVPSGSEDAFKSHSEWGKFFKDETGNGALTVSPSTLDLVMNDSKSFKLSLSDYTNYTAVQFDIEVPDGVSIPDNGIVYNTACSSTHKSEFSRINNSNLYRVLLYSSTSKSAFKSGSNIFTVTLNSDKSFRGGTVNVKSIVLTNVNSKEKKPAAVSVNIPTFTPVTEISISPSAASLYIGETSTLKATINPTGAISNVTWSSSNPSVATVDAQGVVTGKAKGTATITATATDGSGVKASVDITVMDLLVTGISISPSATDVYIGTPVTLTATVTPTNAKDPSLNWTSSNSSIATVKDGVVTGLKPGSVTITATSKDGSNISASATITVKPVVVTSISVTPSTQTMEKGETLTLSASVMPSNATDGSLTWTSSDTSVATVSPTGVVTASGAGTATITATANDGSEISGSATITVTNFVKEISLNMSQVELEIEKTAQLTATYMPQDAEEVSLTWSSADTKIATVSSTGLVTAVGTGTVTVKVTDSTSGCEATCEVVVNDYLYGDSNDDGNVSISDVNTTVAYILEKDPQPFSFSKADVNKNGEVNVTDVVLTVDILLSQPSQTDVRFASRSNNTTNGHIALNDITLDKNGKGYLVASLDALIDACSMKADLTLPEGLHVSDITICDGQPRQDSLAWAQVDGSNVRFIIYSMLLKELKANGSDLVRIGLYCDSDFEEGMISIANVVGADDKGSETMINGSQCYVKNGDTTGIDLVSADGISVSKAGSEIVVKAPEGMKAYIFDINGHTVHEFTTSGSDAKVVSGGIYIVVVGKETFKIYVD